MLDFEMNTKEILEKNDEYITIFAKYLEDNGLKNNTINKHCVNVSFYINEYLIYYQNKTMEEGTDFENLDGFFGDFFIRKCMWSTPKSIKENLAGLNKFYKCMFEKKYISSANYKNYKNIVKNYKEAWAMYCHEYNNLDEDIFFDLF